MVCEVRRRYLITLCFVLSSIAVRADGKASEKKPYENIRLTTSVKPIHYDIHLDVNMQSFQVTGKLSVTVAVTTPTLYFIVHGVDFQTIKGTLLDSHNKVIPILKQFTYPENQFQVIQLAKEVPEGFYKLQFEFSYILRKSLAGFYQARYKTKTGEVRTIATTQFEPADARSAFPCFDEPSMKATFNLTMSYPKEYMAVSNSPIVKTWYDKSGATRYNQFGRTPKMSSYLLAFVVCDFKSITVTSMTRKPVQMTLYAPEEQIDQLHFAADVGSKVLPFYEKYYNISYPLPKEDMIAIPDFAAGAMENWGLITYRLVDLLYDKTASSIANKRRVAEVVAHEFGHQWFGDLVTLDWWSDLWLNEGFASYASKLAMDAIRPEWKVIEDAVVTVSVRAMDNDALVSSHPIHIEVHKPSEIGAIFGAITYAKGESILRMLDNFLGTETFKKGLHNYLQKYSYGNARTQDLWEQLSKASRLAGDNLNVSKIMNTWVFQMGFPVVNVTKQGNGVYKLSQSWFLHDPHPDLNKTKFVSPYGYKWVIPFNYVTLDSSKGSTVVTPVKKVWMDMGDAYVDLGSDDLIIKGNYGQFGFFRVNYDKSDWNKIISILKVNHEIFGVKDRAGLLQDAFALAASGRLDYQVALDMFDYIGKDTDTVPWKAGKNVISFIARMLENNLHTEKLLKKYMLTKVSDLYMKDEFRTVTDYLERNLQILAAGSACHNGHKGCIQKSSELFNDWMNNGKSVPNDFRALVYYYGVQNGGRKEWNFVLQKYLHAKSPSEKITLLTALCSSKDLIIINKLLRYTFDGDIIKNQDVGFIYSGVSHSNEGRRLAWNFVKNNFYIMQKRFASQLRTFGGIIAGVISGFKTEADLKEVEHFFKTVTTDISDIKLTVAKGLENIKASIQWLKTNKDTVEKWLKLKL